MPACSACGCTRRSEDGESSLHRHTAAMKVPKSGKGINKKWVEHILKEHTEATNPPTLLRVDTCTVRKDLGDGFNSQVVFFTVETTEKNESCSTEVKKVYHLVSKLLSPEPMVQMLNNKLKANLKEYLVYTDLISVMNKMLSAKAPEESRISIPELIYGKYTSKEFVLVMEDLQYTGYEMNDKQKGLNGVQLKAVVNQIAKVHALSYVFRESAEMSKYSCFPSLQEHLNSFTMILGAILDNCIKFLKTFKETEELGKKVHLCKSALFEKFTTFLHDDYTIKCLIHGDCWNNNFMFKYGDASDGQIIEDVMIIDWGNSSWGSPIFDLQYLMYTSTTRTIRKDHLDEVLNHYHQTFMRLTTHLGSPPVNWSLKQLKTEWNEAYVSGFLCGCALTLGTLDTINPVNVKPEPSVLDKPLLLPIKFVVDGMKMGAAKVITPLILSSVGQKFIRGIMTKMWEPILEEFKSGKHEVVKTRLLEIFYEADESGLFTA